MEKINKNEKTCMFFASDYHFEMITLPYIKKNLENEKEIIIITENNLNESIEKLLSNMNIDKEEKDKIINLNWENNNSNKINRLNKLEEKQTIVFVKGREDFIKETNKKIIENNNLEVVDCYDISEVQDNIKEIVEEHTKVLSTSGIEKLL